MNYNYSNEVLGLTRKNTTCDKCKAKLNEYCKMPSGKKYDTNSGIHASRVKKYLVERDEKISDPEPISSAVNTLFQNLPNRQRVMEITITIKFQD